MTIIKIKDYAFKFHPVYKSWDIRCCWFAYVGGYPIIDIHFWHFQITTNDFS